MTADTSGTDAGGTTTGAALPAAPEHTLVQKLLAEVLGTFVLVFFGCGSVVLASEKLLRAQPGDATFFPTFTTIGLTFGLAVMIMVYAVGRISGGHFNPAVTLGAAIGGRLAWNQVLVYVGAQIVGAIAGALTLFVLAFGYADFDPFEGNLGANGWGDQGGGYAWWSTILLEIVMTAIFVFVILAVTDSRNEHPAMAPLTIGLTLAAIHFVAIPADGTSVNPARSLGPALFSGGDALIQLPIFLIAPLIGAAIAGVLYPALYGHGTGPVKGSGLKRRRRPVGAVPGYGAPDAFQQQWSQQQWGQQPAGGTGQTGQTGQTGYAATGGQAAAAPIIQDGWQWDPAAQQWIPAQQQPPATGQTGQQSGQHAAWPNDTDGDETQARPNPPQ